MCAYFYNRKQVSQRIFRTYAQNVERKSIPQIKYNAILRQLEIHLVQLILIVRGREKNIAQNAIMYKTKVVNRTDILLKNKK